MDGLIDEFTVAENLRVSVKTIQNWRQLGRGPRYIAISKRCIRYKPEDVQAWVERQAAYSTSEVAARALDEVTIP